MSRSSRINRQIIILISLCHLTEKTLSNSSLKYDFVNKICYAKCFSKTKPEASLNVDNEITNEHGLASAYND